MKKTLIVKYLPSGEKSNTKTILDLFIHELNNLENQDIESLDLLKKTIPIFNEETISCYYKRNYHGQSLNPQESKLLSVNDELIKQLKSADNIILACPMHNFGFPAQMKAYIDAVTFHNETFAYNKKMMEGKKILTIFTSGGLYSKDEFGLNYPNWDGLSLTAKLTFNFMGFDEVATLGTSLRDEQSYQDNLSKMSNEIKNIINKWYL
jgi:FMN-dependent NADH-azoreductase